MSLTMDSWTALTTESCVMFLCHYINDWGVQSAVMQTKAMSERHTAKYLANELSNAKDHWVLTGKLTCVYDNARNMVMLTTNLDWTQPYFTHTLQLVSNDGFKLPNINHVVQAANSLFFPFSSQHDFNRGTEAKATTPKLACA